MYYILIVFEQLIKNSIPFITHFLNKSRRNFTPLQNWVFHTGSKYLNQIKQTLKLNLQRILAWLGMRVKMLSS